VKEIGMSSSEESSAVRYVVSGRVQGVGFRFFTRRLATDLQLRGTVRNMADGTVEAVAIGSEAALAEFEVVLGAGPAASRVDRVTRQPQPAATVEPGFNIVY